MKDALDLEAMRFYADDILRTVDLTRMDEYAEVFASKALMRRYITFKN